MPLQGSQRLQERLYRHHQRIIASAWAKADCKG